MENELIKLASTHLGKAGDGTIVKPYTTPDKHDKSLLVALPRQLNRKKSNIKSANTFEGYEVWHAYEMSFLTMTGMPATGVLKICYTAKSDAMVESKSLKLYLNSFDLEKFESVQEVEQTISNDLSSRLGDDVQVTFHPAHKADYLPSTFGDHFTNVDDRAWEITDYKEDSSLLDKILLRQEESLWFHTNNLRSNCEITNQKDTGNCYIYIKSTKLPTLPGLTKYVISFRDSQHFHENVTEIMYDTLNNLYEPSELVVANIFNRRGGIDIHSVRGTNTELIERIVGNYRNTKHLFEKTVQQ